MKRRTAVESFLFGTALILIITNSGCRGSASPVGETRAALNSTITIDATRLTDQQLFFSNGVNLVTFDSLTPQPVQEASGANCVIETGIGSVIGSFTVDSNGSVQYDPALDNIVFSGLGTSTIVVVAHAVDIDASGLTPQSLYLNYGNANYFDSSTVQHLKLPAAASGSCVLETGAGSVIGRFTVNSAGKIDYDSSLDNGVLRGLGTSTLAVAPHLINIDARGLSQQQLIFNASDASYFDSSATRQLELAAAGAYRLETASGGIIGTFTVTSSGTISYDASLDNVVFTGLGTSTLVVRPYSINIDATALSPQQLYLLDGSNSPAFDTRTVQQPKLAPGPAGSYVLETGNGSLIGAFTVDTSGHVEYDSSLDQVVFTGLGTSTLAVVAHSISVDATAVPEQQLRFVYGNSSPVFDSGAVQQVQLAAAQPESYLLQTLVGAPIGSFQVRPDGTIDYDPLLEGVFSGRGTTTLLLKAIPAWFTLDATALTQKTIALSPTGAIVNTNSPVSVPVLTAVTYYLQPAAIPSSVGFSVASDGTITYDGSLEGVLSGNGTKTLTVHGRRITLNATALSQPTITVPTFGTPLSINTQSPASLVLVPATGYGIGVGTRLTANFAFDLDLSGNVHISPSYALVATGDSTPALTLRGAHVSIAPYMTNTSLAFANLSGNGITIPTGQATSVNLLPLQAGSVYNFLVGAGAITTFGFNLDLSGNFQYTSTFNSYVQGQGTTALTINAPRITIDASPDGAGQFQVGPLYGVGSLDRTHAQSLALMPVAGGYSFTDDSGTFSFLVKEDGTVDYAPSLDGEFSGRGTSTLIDAANSCLGYTPAESAAIALDSGWLFAAQVCLAGPATQQLPLVPTPYNAPTRPRPTGSAPAITPPSIARLDTQLGIGKGGTPPVAGGDPVLADGEFFLQRTDAQLAGSGLPYEFTRTYRSRVDFNGSLGVAWQHNYDKRIVMDAAFFDNTLPYDNPCLGDPTLQGADYYDGALNVVHFKWTAKNCSGNECVHYLSPPAGTFLSLEHHMFPSQTDPTGQATSYWRMVDPEGNVLRFDQDGNIKTIINPAGNFLTFNWTPVANDLPRLGSVVDTAGRTISYIYDQPDRTGKLQCITLGTSCGTASSRDEKVLAYFVYVNGGAGATRYLRTVYRGQDTHGELYAYSDQAVPIWPIHDPNSTTTNTISPTDCISNPALDISCHRLCDPITGDPDTCYYAAGAVRAQARCNTLAHTATSCGVQVQAPPSDSTVACDPNGAKAVMPIGPCLAGSDQIPWSNLFPNGVQIWDGTAFDPTGEINCVRACEQRHQCWGYFGDVVPSTSPKWRPFYTFGGWTDLQNNITDVYDENGNVVVHNDYGANLNHIDYDRVFQQIVGPTTDLPNTMYFSYHDFDIEDNGVFVYSLRNYNYDPHDPNGNKLQQPWGNGDPDQYPQGGGDDSIWFGAPSLPDPKNVLDANGRSLATVVNVCPPDATAGSSPTYQTYKMPAVSQSLKAPATAVVITDIHNAVRTQYYDTALNLLREDLHMPDGSAETARYNYDGNNQITGVMDASGVRTCLEHDSSGRTKQLTRLPSLANFGDTTPLVSVYGYNDGGQLIDSYADVAHGTGAMVHTHLQREPATERVVEQDQDGVTIPSNTPLVTKYSYAEINSDKPPPGVRETPSEVTLPDGVTVNQYRQIDSSLGGPTIIDLNANASPDSIKHLYAYYDNLGRTIESGEVNRFAQQFVYDPVSTKLQQVNHTYQRTSSPFWIQGSVTYHLVDGQVKLDYVHESTPNDTGRATFYAYGGRQYPIATNYQSGGPQVAGEPPLPAQQTTCFHYTADGQLRDSILPEGEQVHYDYDTAGRLTRVLKGYGAVPNPATAWSAGCPSNSPPFGDPGPAPVRAMSYQPGGFLAWVSANDVQREVTTDGFGRIIQTRGVASPPNGLPSNASLVAVRQWGYDGFGRVIWEAAFNADQGLPANPYRKPTTTATAGLLEMTEYGYDIFGRTYLVKAWNIQKQQWQVTSTTYDDRTRIVTTTDQVVPWSGNPTDPGRSVTRTFDGLGRLVLETTQPKPSSKSITYAIDSNTGVYSATVVLTTNQPGPLTRVYQYDTRGNLTRVLDGSNNELAYATYDDQNNVLVTRQDGTTQGSVTRLRDRLGRIVHVDTDIVAGKTAPTDYVWDRENRPTSYTDGEGHQWSTTFSGLDQPITTSGPAGYSKMYFYRSGFASHPEGTQDSYNRRACYRYDADLQLAFIYADVCPSGQPLIGPLAPPLTTPDLEDRTYTVLGQLNGLTGHKWSTRPADASVTLTYDSLGRVTDQTVNGGDSSVPSYTVHHDFADEIQAVNTTFAVNAPGAQMPVSYQHQFDPLGRLSTVSLNGTPIANYDYGTSGIGGPLTLSYPTIKTTTSLFYDAKLRQTGMDVSFTTKSGQTSIIASLHDAFGVDSVPRLRQRQIGSGAKLTDVFQVDLLNRIIAENTLVSAIALPQQEVDNNYPGVANNIQSGSAWRAYDVIDNVGNWKTVRTSTGSVSDSFDALSQLTAVGSQEVANDGMGDLKGFSDNSGPQFSFDTYTGTMLTQSNAGSSNSYVYDALGRRATETSSGVAVAFFWDGNTVIAHGDPNVPTIDIPADDIDGHIASVEQNGAGKSRYYHQGPDQSVLAVSDENGLVEGYSYSAFGETSFWSPNGSAQGGSTFNNRFLFQGQLFDPLTATYAMRSRQYQPNWGRFLSPDPMSFTAGPSLYSFTGSRPLNRRDPLGLQEAGPCDELTCGEGGDTGGDPVPPIIAPPQTGGSYTGGFTGGVSSGGVTVYHPAPTQPTTIKLAVPGQSFSPARTGGGSRGTPGAINTGQLISPIGFADLVRAYQLDRYERQQWFNPAPVFNSVAQSAKGTQALIKVVGLADIAVVGGAFAIAALAPGTTVAAGTQIAPLSAEGMALGQNAVNGLRVASQVGRGRNIAVAIVQIEGQALRILQAASGRHLFPGLLGASQYLVRLFQTGEGADFDSEVAIFEELAGMITRTSVGVVRLFTERPACPSCWGVAEQFAERYPLIKIIIGGGD
jgi:RHS repeat-associated protein